MEGHCSTGQSPQRAVVPMEEEEDIIKLFTVAFCVATDVRKSDFGFL